MKRSKIIFLILSIFLVLILSFSLTYYLIKTKPPSIEGDVTVLAIIHYGSLKAINVEEYNVTVESGSSALKIFSQIATLETTNFSIGIYIRGVNGYLEDLPYYWSFQYFDVNTKTWVYSEIGVDKYFVINGDKIKLQYTG